MKSQKLLLRLSAGHVKNVRFRDIQKMLGETGFSLQRVSGSHHIYGHAEVNELVNVQNVNGEAKPYQIRQILHLIEKYGLAEE